MRPSRDRWHRHGRWAAVRSARLQRTAARKGEQLSTDDKPADDADLGPILGEIARAFGRIHPLDLTDDEAFSLLTILMKIESRLDGETAQGLNVRARPKLRLVRVADNRVETLGRSDG